MKEARIEKGRLLGELGGGFQMSRSAFSNSGELAIHSGMEGRAILLMGGTLKDREIGRWSERPEPGAAGLRLEG